MSFAEGAAIACGTGTAYAALKRLNVSGRDTLAIFGQGAVGLSATQLAVAMGARVIAVDPSPQRRAMSMSMGASVALDTVEVVEAIREMTHGAHGTATFEMTPDVIHRQLTMLGCWTFNPALMAECARFAVERQVPLARVFTEEFTLDQATEAYQRVEAREMGKGVFILPT